MSTQGAAHVGREVTAEALGRTWTFSRWTRQVWEDFAAWAREKLPDPIDTVLTHIDKANLKDAETLRKVLIQDQQEEAAAKKEGRPPVLLAGRFKPTADLLVDRAVERRNCYLSFNSRELQSLIASVPGSAYLFYLLLKPRHPDLTEDGAYDVFMDLTQAKGQAEVERVFGAVSGRAPAPKNPPAPAA